MLLHTAVIVLVAWGAVWPMSRMGAHAITHVESNDDDDNVPSDFYEKFSSEDMVPSSMGWRSGEEPLTKFRHSSNQSEQRKTLSPEELLEVKGALEKLLAGRELDKFFTTTVASSVSIDDETKTMTTATDDTPHAISHIASTSNTTLATELLSILSAYIQQQKIKITRTPERSPTRSHTPKTTVPYHIFQSGNYDGLLRDDADTADPDTTTTTPTPTTTTPTPTTTTPTPTTTTSKLTTTTQKKTTTTPKPTKKQPKLDIPALLALIANLTYDYETNLTAWLNESLQLYNIPTCPPLSTTAPPSSRPTTPLYDYTGNFTGTIMGKCFVCGLEVTEIPRTSHCADAFAGDFLPLVPVDPTARAQISIYRKYCRYMNVPHYHYNATDPRSLWGRWTGGCSVRWIDLSSVYTQRSCRNRHKAIMGKHYVSKRMAKLEMALQHVDNGCIISPMASLVPLSRGVSLYARFHACVCTGSWCNRTVLKQPSVPYIAVVSLLLAYIT